MSEADKKKWDQKYKDKPQLLEFREASDVVKRFAFNGKGQTALDLACGTGRNTLHLANEHFEVDAVDIAAVALDTLYADASGRGLLEYVKPLLLDLDDFTPESERYDVIVMCNFLDRLLIERTKVGLKRGGLYIVETYMADVENEKKDSMASNLLQAGELKEIFAESFKVIYYDEHENERHEMYKMKKQVIVVEKL